MLSPQLYNLRAMPLSGEDSRIKMIAPANSGTPTSANLFCAANITRTSTIRPSTHSGDTPRAKCLLRVEKDGAAVATPRAFRTGTAIDHSAGTALINPAHCLKKKEALRGNADRRSALAAKSANCARLTWDLAKRPDSESGPTSRCDPGIRDTPQLQPQAVATG